MRRFFLLTGFVGILAAALPAEALPLSTLGSFCSLFPFECQRGTESLLAARGIGTNTYYVVEVDPTTGAIPTSASIVFNSEGTPGAAAPAKALQVAGTDGTNLLVLRTDASGNQRVVGTGTAGTPSGGVLSVQGVTSGTALPISATALPLPTGASTAAKQPALGTAGTASADVITVQGIAGATAVKVDGSGVTQPVSGTVTANAGTGTFAISAAALPLPTGAATAAKQPALGTAGTPASDVITVQGVSGGTAQNVQGTGTAGTPGTAVLTVQGISGGTAQNVNAQNFPATVATDTGASSSSTIRVVPATRSEAAATPLSTRLSDGTSFLPTGNGTATGALRVTTASDAASPAGRTYADSARYAYTSGSVSTASWVQLIASTAAKFNCVQLFDSSGQTLELGVGAAASEARVMLIPPGGFDGCFGPTIAAGSRISIRAVSGTAATGEIDITGFN